MGPSRQNHAAQQGEQHSIDLELASALEPDIMQHFRQMNDIDSKIVRLAFLRMYRAAHRLLRKTHKAVMSVLDRNQDGKIDLLDLADYRKALKGAGSAATKLLTVVAGVVEARATAAVRFALTALAPFDALAASHPSQDESAAAQRLHIGLLHLAAANQTRAAGAAAAAAAAAARLSCIPSRRREQR
jgi:hypothetical protein